MPYIDKEKFRMHIIMYQHNPLKVKLTDKEKEKFTRMLDEVPTADVAEVKRGRWYKPKEYPRDSYRYICTVCQEVAYFVTGNNGKKHKEDYPRCGYKFCPNCGADMREET